MCSQGIAAQRGCELRMIHTDLDEGLAEDALLAALGPDVALVSLSHVAYRSGALADMARITGLVHDAGALMLWDLCHSVGAVPVRLDESGADLAIGCTYKYLNAGPGAPAFLYVRTELQDRLRQPIWGWFGQHDQFAMGPVYDPVPGIERFAHRHAADHRHGRGRRGHQAARRGRHRPAAREGHRADQLPDPSGRRVARAARLPARLAARRRPPRQSRDPASP